MILELTQFTGISVVLCSFKLTNYYSDTTGALAFLPLFIPLTFPFPSLFIGFLQEYIASACAANRLDF